MFQKEKTTQPAKQLYTTTAAIFEIGTCFSQPDIDRDKLLSRVQTLQEHIQHIDQALIPRLTALLELLPTALTRPFLSNGHLSAHPYTLLPPDQITYPEGSDMARLQKVVYTHPEGEAGYITDRLYLTESKHDLSNTQTHILQRGAFLSNFKLDTYLTASDPESYLRGAWKLRTLRSEIQDTTASLLDTGELREVFPVPLLTILDTPEYRKFDAALLRRQRTCSQLEHNSPRQKKQYQDVLSHFLRTQELAIAHQNGSLPSSPSLTERITNNKLILLLILVVGAGAIGFSEYSRSASEKKQKTNTLVTYSGNPCENQGAMPMPEALWNGEKFDLYDNPYDFIASPQGYRLDSNINQLITALNRDAIEHVSGARKDPHMYTSNILQYDNNIFPSQLARIGLTPDRLFTGYQYPQESLLTRKDIKINRLPAYRCQLKENRRNNTVAFFQSLPFDNTTQTYTFDQPGKPSLTISQETYQKCLMHIELFDYNTLQQIIEGAMYNYGHMANEKDGAMQLHMLNVLCDNIVFFPFSNGTPGNNAVGERVNNGSNSKWIFIDVGLVNSGSLEEQKEIIAKVTAHEILHGLFQDRVFNERVIETEGYPEGAILWYTYLLTNKDLFVRNHPYTEFINSNFLLRYFNPDRLYASQIDAVTKSAGLSWFGEIDARSVRQMITSLREAHEKKLMTDEEIERFLQVYTAYHTHESRYRHLQQSLDNLHNRSYTSWYLMQLLAQDKEIFIGFLKRFIADSKANQSQTLSTYNFPLNRQYANSQETAMGHAPLFLTPKQAQHLINVLEDTPTLAQESFLTHLDSLRRPATQVCTTQDIVGCNQEADENNLLRLVTANLNTNEINATKFFAYLREPPGMDTVSILQKYPRRKDIFTPEHIVDTNVPPGIGEGGENEGEKGREQQAIDILNYIIKQLFRSDLSFITYIVLFAALIRVGQVLSRYTKKTASPEISREYISTANRIEKAALHKFSTRDLLAGVYFRLIIGIALCTLGEVGYIGKRKYDKHVAEKTIDDIGRERQDLILHAHEIPEREILPAEATDTNVHFLDSLRTNRINQLTTLQLQKSKEIKDIVEAEKYRERIVERSGIMFLILGMGRIVLLLGLRKAKNRTYYGAITSAVEYNELESLRICNPTTNNTQQLGERKKKIRGKIQEDMKRNSFLPKELPIDTRKKISKRALQQASHLLDAFFHTIKTDTPPPGIDISLPKNNRTQKPVQKFTTDRLSRTAGTQNDIPSSRPVETYEAVSRRDINRPATYRTDRLIAFEKKSSPPPHQENVSLICRCMPLETMTKDIIVRYLKKESLRQKQKVSSKKEADLYLQELIHKTLGSLYHDLIHIYQQAIQTQSIYYVHIYMYGQSVCSYRIDRHTPLNIRDIISEIYTFLFTDFLYQLEDDNIPSQEDITQLDGKYSALHKKPLQEKILITRRNPFTDLPLDGVRVVHP